MDKSPSSPVFQDSLWQTGTFVSPSVIFFSQFQSQSHSAQVNRSRQGHCKERRVEGGFQLTSVFPSPACAVLLWSLHRWIDKGIVPVGVELGMLPYRRLK